jgi:hypothetical protein
MGRRRRRRFLSHGFIWRAKSMTMMRRVTFRFYHTVVALFYPPSTLLQSEIRHTQHLSLPFLFFLLTLHSYIHTHARKRKNRSTQGAVEFHLDKNCLFACDDARYRRSTLKLSWLAI